MNSGALYSNRFHNFRSIQVAWWTTHSLLTAATRVRLCTAIDSGCMWKRMAVTLVDTWILSGCSCFHPHRLPLRANICVNERYKYKLSKLFINRCRINKVQFQHNDYIYQFVNYATCNTSFLLCPYLWVSGSYWPRFCDHLWQYPFVTYTSGKFVKRLRMIEFKS